MIYCCLAAIAIFYFGYWLRRYIQQPDGKTKMTLAATFCIIAAAAALRRGFDSFAVIVLVGMLCGALGDYFLINMSRDSSAFLRGVAAFSANQAAYIFAMVFIGHRNTAATLVLFAALMAISLFILYPRRDKLGRERMPVLIYLVLVTWMGAKAATLPFAFGGAERMVFAFGGVLFYVSDFLLALWRYLGRDPRMRAANSLLYFTGQFLIAASLLL